MPVLIHHGIRLFCASAALDQLLTLTGDRVRRWVTPFEDGTRFELAGGVTATAVPVCHDDKSCHAYRFDRGPAAIGYATDLGHVPPALLDHLVGVGLVAIESNYDPTLQRGSGRPAFLQRRITGGRGHLSNDQAYAAVRGLLDRCKSAGRRPPRRVVLLHRSRQCNAADVVRRTFFADARLAGRVVLSEQDRRTEWVDAADPLPALVGEQLTLGFG